MNQLLRSGSSGPPVKELQTVLNTIQHPVPALVIDGLFGPKTYAAVVAFQRRALLTPDGIVGPKTSAALVSAALTMA